MQIKYGGRGVEVQVNHGGGGGWGCVGKRKKQRSLKII